MKTQIKKTIKFDNSEAVDLANETETQANYKVDASILQDSNNPNVIKGQMEIDPGF